MKEGYMALKKTISNYCIPIVAFFCSVGLQIVSSTPFFDGLIAKIVIEERIPQVKSIIEVINFLVFIIPIGIQSVVRAKKAKLYEDVLVRLGQEKRKNTAMILSSSGSLQCDQDISDDINIRFFKKRWNRLVLEEKPGFYNKEINGALSFSIKKNEGLCVKAYNEGHSMLEIEDASRKEYNLTTRQKALAGQLRFIVAVPIIPEGSNSVTRVICFDSFQKIAKNGCEQSIIITCERLAYMIDSII